MIEIIIAIIGLISVIVSSVGTLVVKNYLDKKKINKTIHCAHNKAECWMQLDRIAADIRKHENAKGCFIAYFHNGGKFISGIAMDKFTVIADDFDETIEDSYKNIYKNALTSIMSYPILRLYKDNQYIFHKNNFEKTEANKAFINDLDSRKVNTVASIIIKDLVTDMPIGFVAVEYEGDIHTQDITMATLWKYHNRISRYMNMFNDEIK